MLKFNVLVLAVAMIIGVGAYFSHASERTNGPVVAVVDMQKVYDESGLRQMNEQQLMTYGQELAKQFNDISNLPYLSPTEVKELSDLMIKPNPTPADTSQMQALEQKSRQLSQEMNKLQTTSDSSLTPADRARIQQLAGMMSTWRGSVEALTPIYQKMANDQDTKTQREAMDTIRKEVAKIAKSQHLTEVFSVSSLVYCDHDITNDVVKQIKKAKLVTLNQ
ncbi:MAG: OmpH family outer membrane protein [Armatimonadetes bacterium]|nr:OmpH family outer membrane protein [Armatimonadota bacterium]